MSFACYLYALIFYLYILVCDPYVTRMYSYVIRMSLVCARISSVTHMWFYNEPNIYDLKNLNEYEIKQNSTWRELFAIQFALQSFAPKITNKSVYWETGNYPASLTVVLKVVPLVAPTCRYPKS